MGKPDIEVRQWGVGPQKIRESPTPHERSSCGSSSLQGKIENWKLCNAFCQLDGLAVN